MMNENQHVFANRVILITGGASGIGQATARAFAAAGATVGILDVCDDSTLAAEVAALCAMGGKAAGRRCDIADAEPLEYSQRRCPPILDHFWSYPCTQALRFNQNFITMPMFARTSKQFAAFMKS
jgi:nucleoside-diphosphate-sugar epimerase